MEWGAGVSRPSPRVRQALRLYATGAARTLKEAAEAVGVSKEYLSITNASPAGRAYVDKVVEDLDERSIDMSVLLDRLSLKALKRVEDLMDESESETIQLTAARDLLDRGPRTSKVQRHQVMAMTLDGRDAQQIASALVEAAQARQEFSAASGNYIRATDMPQVIAPAPEAPTPDGD